MQGTVKGKKGTSVKRRQGRTRFDCQKCKGRRCSLWGWRKGIPGGGAFHHCEGRLRSGAVPPRTARPLGGLLGSATHVLWARVCWCGGPTLFPWPARHVGAACRGGGGGPSPGGVGPPPL